MTKAPALRVEELLTPIEVASMFRVDPKTVTRWARAGKLTSMRTLGGHRRYRREEVQTLMVALTDTATSTGTAVADGDDADHGE